MRALRQVVARAADVGDPILVALLAGTALIEALVRGRSLADAVLAGAIALPLLARRRAPLLVLALAIGAGYVGYAVGPEVGAGLQSWIVLNVAVYTVAAHCPLRRALLGAAVTASFVLWFEIPKLVEGAALEDVAGEWISLGGVWLLGRWVRGRRRGTADLERQAAGGRPRGAGARGGCR